MVSNLKIGDVVICKNEDIDPDLYWTFIIVSRFEFKSKTFFVGVKNGADHPDQLWPVIFDSDGVQVLDLDVGQFIITERSRAKKNLVIYAD